MRWQRDEIDMLCEDWARQRRQMLGIDDLQPRDRLGKLRCTLGAVREERDGASQGTVNQSFPEVYTDMALMVHRAILEMNRQWRPVMNIHYVLREIPVSRKSKEVGLSVSMYWRHLTFGKNFIQSFVMLSTKLDPSPKNRVQTQCNFANSSLGAIVDA